MEVAAKHKYARISPRKARLIADQIRGLPAHKAMEVLDFSVKRAAKMVKKVLNSAMANAEHNNGADIDELRISKVFVDEGMRIKRIRPRAKGRACRIIKPTCHITVAVSDEASGS